MNHSDRREERRNERRRILDLLAGVLEEDQRDIFSRPLAEEFSVVLAGYRKPMEPKKEEKKQFSPELMAISEAFNRLEQCVRDLVDTLQILPENIARCVKEAIHTKSEEELDTLEKKVAVVRDKKTGKNVFILDTAKDLGALDETEGILQKIWEKLEKEKIDTPELVKRAWKRA